MKELTVEKTTTETVTIQVEFPLYLKYVSFTRLVKFTDEKTGYELQHDSIKKADTTLEYYLGKCIPSTADEFNELIKTTEANIRACLAAATYEANDIPNTTRQDELADRESEMKENENEIIEEQTENENHE